MAEYPEQAERGRDGRRALKVLGLSKWFGGEQVLDSVSFSILEGESLVILGHSGSGKTTTLRIIAGLEAPDTGEIFLKGRRIEHLRARERNVGVIFQNYALFPRMTVRENICFGLRIRGIGKGERERVAAELLAMVGLPEQSEKYPWQLSGGQQQRVAIARALAYQPDLLLFDEPFSALDPQTRSGLRREIRALLRRLRIPALFITHDQEEAMELGDQIAILNCGRIEQIGTAEEVYHHPRTEFVARFLGAANVIEGVVESSTIVGECGWRLPVSGAVSGAVSAAIPPAIPAAIPPDYSSIEPNGARRQLFFRPEDVILLPVGQPVEWQSLECRLGEGIVGEVSFFGATEWVTVNLQPTVKLQGNGQDRRADSAPLAIRVSRMRWEARQLKLAVGDSVTIGLRSFRLLGK